MTRHRSRLLAFLWRPLIQGVRTLLGRDNADQELAEEMAHYLQEAEAELRAQGATPQEARRAVRLRYGDGLSAREDVRSYGWESTVEEIFSDVRLAARRLRRTPGFTAVAVLTLGLGIGAATAIFSAVRPVLFEPLGYPDAHRLVALSDRSDEGAPVPVTFGTYVELKERVGVFSDLTVYKPWQPTLTGVTEPERLNGQAVSAEYFAVLGVSPALGPGFDAADDRPGGPRRVVMSHGLWQRRFGSDPGVVGGTVRLDGEAYAVVGVMPPDFENVTGLGSQVWSLLQYDPRVADFLTREWGHHLEMMGRLNEGVTPDGARTALDRVTADPIPAFPRPQHAALDMGILVQPLRDAATAQARPTMVVLLGAVGLLLLITCVNVTMLVLARGARRSGELAMREALGAGRSRLARHLLTESLLLAGLGGVVGVAVARIGLAGLVAVSPPSLPRLAAVALDGSALALALGLTTVFGLVFGLLPALGRPGHRLPQAVRGTGRGSRGTSSARHILVVVEVAMAVVLLVGAGLLLRSTQRIFSEPLGFDPSDVVVMQIYATGLERGDRVTHQFFDAGLEAVGNVPGVSSAALTSQLPLSGDVDGYGVTRGDGPTADGEVDGAAYRYAVSPGYFETLGLELVRGRGLQAQDDAGGPRAAVVSASLARRMYPDGDPLGHRIHLGPVEGEPYTIVGVVADVKQASLGARDSEAVYVTSHQWHWADRVRWIVVRTDQDVRGLLPALHRAVWSVDRNQPITRAQSMERLVARSEAQRRFVLVVVLAFALAALALAGIGLYGVLAGSVTERMRELGVRAALGASREVILGIVVRQGMTLTALGGVVGVAAAVVASRILVTLLYGVTRLDMVTYLAVTAMLGVVAALACWIPGARAARVDPLTSLRSE